MTIMDKNYIPPQVEVIRMDSYMAPLCASGGNYHVESGVFDFDSDTSD